MLEITIPPEDSDHRLDRYLKKYLQNAPLSLIFRSLRTGKIKLNGKKSPQDTRLLSGDVITLFYTPEEIEAFTRESISEKKSRPTMILDSSSICYEDDFLMVIDKPAGLNVHPGDHKTTENSLIDQVRDYLARENRDRSKIFQPSLVHRLDRDTSGAILIAKDRHTLNALLAELQNGKIEKIYHTIVIGTPEPPQGTIRARLLRVENAQKEAKVRVDPSGQEAITHYTTLRQSLHGDFSLLQIRIETGRMHQIRVHMASIGTPILGDKSYGRQEENTQALRKYQITRQMLHAHSLTFMHPVTRSRLTVVAPYQSDMQDFLDSSSAS